MSKCIHYWNYDHCIYNNNKVRRWCSFCGLIQTGEITKWRPEQSKDKFGQCPTRYKSDDFDSGCQHKEASGAECFECAEQEQEDE